jgi:hypothetical protein
MTLLSNQTMLLWGTGVVLPHAILKRLGSAWLIA